MLILNRDGTKKDWPSKVDMDKVLETPLPMEETSIPTKEDTLEELKRQFNKGAKLEFFSSKKNSWQPCPNPTWKTTTVYRVACPPSKKYKTKEVWNEEFPDDQYIITHEDAEEFMYDSLEEAQQAARNLAQTIPGEIVEVARITYSVFYTIDQIEVNDE